MADDDDGFTELWYRGRALGYFPITTLAMAAMIFVPYDAAAYARFVAELTAAGGLRCDLKDTDGVTGSVRIARAYDGGDHHALILGDDDQG